MDFSRQRRGQCLLLDSVSSVLQNKLFLENATYIALYTVLKFLEIREETTEKGISAVSKLEEAAYQELLPP